MESGKFDVVKFISSGSYSIVYEVVYPQAGDRTTPMTWALKRFYLQNSSAVRCALREHGVLVRLALADKQSPFIVTLLQSLRIRGAPALLLQKGSGYDLRDLIFNVGLLDERDARFYSCEIVCGLGHLHAMGIVHMDIKPTNILIADSGHLLISDFDRAYDLTRATGPPKRTDFTGSPFYMAPEIRHRVEITTKADVWSLGILVASIMYGNVAVEEWLHTYRFATGRLPNVSTPLRQFFKACLMHNYERRLDIDGVKCLDFYKDVNWEEVLTCRMEPPCLPSEFDVTAAVEKFDLDPHDPLLLAAAYGIHMLVIDKGLRETRDKNGVRQLVVELPNQEDLAKAGLTPEGIDQLFASFDFANPHYLKSPHGFDERQDVCGDTNAFS
ncbi:Ribosomal protein S6 kinase alpha-2 [Taenia solium]